jgi:hypothetical protein
MENLNRVPRGARALSEDLFRRCISKELVCRGGKVSLGAPSFDLQTLQGSSITRGVQKSSGPAHPMHFKSVSDMEQILSFLQEHPLDLTRNERSQPISGSIGQKPDGSQA